MWSFSIWHLYSTRDKTIAASISVPSEFDWLQAGANGFNGQGGRTLEPPHEAQYRPLLNGVEHEAVVAVVHT